MKIWIFDNAPYYHGDAIQQAQARFGRQNIRIFMSTSKLVDAILTGWETQQMPDLLIMDLFGNTNDLNMLGVETEHLASFGTRIGLAVAQHLRDIGDTVEIIIYTNCAHFLDVQRWVERLDNVKLVAKRDPAQVLLDTIEACTPRTDEE